MSWTDSTLYQSAFASGQSSGSNARERARLTTALDVFRERASLLADEIARSIPQLTDHSVRHLDALWDVASLLCGESVQLNPLETFVFGGAVLMHDVGNSIAAFEGGLAAIRDDKWRDLVVLQFRSRHNRNPTQEEIETPPEPIASFVLLSRLRELHAEQAERLMTRGFLRRTTSGFESLYLLDDSDLRSALGALIGRIAHSHHWDHSRVEQEFGDLRVSPAQFPRDWPVDALKIALLLRSTDAVHVDSRRAPAFLMALRQPEEVSLVHWTFQSRLSRPTVEREHLVYTSSSDFTPSDADAWWLCHDALRMIHDELAAVDDLLLRRRDVRLTARGVLGHDSIDQLCKSVRPNGWIPVDSRVRVTDAIAIVKRFGGKELYGDDDRVALRELIANAADAIRARRTLENRPSTFGEIRIRVVQRDGDSRLSVSDNGIGMSKAVLTGPLLQFGTSYWTSSLSLDEHPGLISRGFRPTGRYGIGFFSAFMLGDQVEVVSRPAARERTAQCHVLRFANGMAGRAVFLAAGDSEFLNDPGTTVTVKLRHDPFASGPFGRTSPFSRPLFGRRQLRLMIETVQRIAPCLDVSIVVECPEGAAQAIEAHDWKRIEFRDLWSRVDSQTRRSVRDQQILSSWTNLEDGGEDFRLDAPSDPIAARLRLPVSGYDAALVVDDGFATTSHVPGFRGVVFGKVEDVARRVATTSLPIERFSGWLATEEYRLARRIFNFMDHAWYASMFLDARLRPKHLKCLLTASGAVSTTAMLASGVPDTLRIVMAPRFRWSTPTGEELTRLFERDGQRVSIDLDADVIVAPVLDASIVVRDGRLGYDGEELSNFVDYQGAAFPWCIPLLCIEVLATLWGTTPTALISERLYTDSARAHREGQPTIGRFDYEQTIGEIGGVRITTPVLCLRRPRG